MPPLRLFSVADRGKPCRQLPHDFAQNGFLLRGRLGGKLAVSVFQDALAGVVRT